MSVVLSHRLAIIWADLEHVVRSLGRGGGLFSPSIYDTAQCFRFDPPTNPWPVVEWLASQQQPDGGWTEAQDPRMRCMPTLAALLALKSVAYSRRATQVAVDSGLAFLYRNQWCDWLGMGADLPYGFELILPRMLDDAHTLGLPIDSAPYAAIVATGERQRVRLQRNGAAPDLAAWHVWEGWGEEPDPALVDAHGTVGGSPAASAFWLSRARAVPALAGLCEQVQASLEKGRAATSSTTEGVVCTRWPMIDHERVLGLYPMLLGGMLRAHHEYNLPPSLRVAVDQQLALVRDSVLGTRTDRLGKAHLDQDTKAVAITMLTAGSLPLPQQMLRHFEQSALTSMSAWPATAPRSLTAVAHTLHALVNLGADNCRQVYQKYLYQHQPLTGLWASEPPNISPHYATAQIMIALLESGAQAAIPAMCQALAMYQHSNGAWGVGDGCTEETAYAVLALLAAKRHRCLPNQFAPALLKAKRWMCDHYRPFEEHGLPLWRGKQLYRAIRIARMVELTALIGLLHAVDD